MKAKNQYLLDDLVAEAQSICILGHVNPDGDCVGSSIGLYLYLTENFPNKKIDVFLGKFSDTFLMIEGTKAALEEETGLIYDLAISTDNADVKRMGVGREAFHKASSTICIDHHKTNQGFGDICILEPECSSSSELVYTLLDEAKISRNCAAALFLGIIHDTGVFRYDCTSVRTMEIAGKLMDKGIEFARIISDTFFDKTYAQQQTLGKMFLTSNLHLEGRCISAYISQKEMADLGITTRDLDGIVSQLKSTIGVHVAIFLYELVDHQWKVSLRSDEYVDVSAIATKYSGGGHIRAAGCTINRQPEEIVEMMVREVKESLGL